MRRMLRNAQWQRIEGMLPGKISDPGRTAADNRLFIEAVLWIARTGCPWRDLLAEFGPWNTACTSALRVFCRLQHFRPVATRDDKLAQRYFSFIALTAAVVWLR